MKLVLRGGLNTTVLEVWGDDSCMSLPGKLPTKDVTDASCKKIQVMSVPLLIMVAAGMCN